MGIIQYGIIILSLALFLIPISQVDGILIPLEITDEKFSTNYDEQQRLLAEKIRDYYFEKQWRLENPYVDNSDETMIFVEQEFNMPSRIDRFDETFQMLKNEQNDLAQIKYLEILGGKIITNSFDNNDKRIIPTLKFTDEEEKIRKAIDRDDEDFKNYKIKQKIIAENTVKELIQGLWEEDPFIIAELFEDNYDPVKDVESVSAAFELVDEGTTTAEELIENKIISPEDLIQNNVISAKNLQLFWKTYEPKESTKPQVQEIIPAQDDFDWDNFEWKKSSRSTHEFQNLISEQILLAEKTRNEEITILPQLNPYLENNETVVTQNNQTETTQEIFVYFKPNINRADEKFQEYKLKQIEKAKLLFKNLYLVENFNKDNFSDSVLQKQLIIQKTDDKIDIFFQLKEFENNKAKEKILGLLGGKNIYN